MNKNMSCISCIYNGICKRQIEGNPDHCEEYTDEYDDSPLGEEINDEEEYRDKN